MFRKILFIVLFFLFILCPYARAVDMSTTNSAGWANPDNRGEYQFKNTATFGLTGNFRLNRRVDLQFSYFHIFSRISERPEWPRHSFDLDELSASLKINHNVQDRINVFGMAGLGYFNHDLSGGEDLLGFVYGLGGEYRLSDKTTLLIQFKRQHHNSNFKAVDCWNTILGGFTFYLQPPKISLPDIERDKIIIKYIATPEIIRSISSIESDRKLKVFVQRYWEANDPTPGTKRNECKEDYLSRFNYTQENFSGYRPGCKTDPGRIWIILGEPDDRIIIPRASAPTPHAYEIWEYWRGWKLKQPVVFVFQEKSAGELYQIECNVPDELGYKGKTYQQIIDEFQFLYLIP